MSKLSKLKNFFLIRIVLIILVSYILLFTALTIPWFIAFNLSFEVSLLIAVLSFSIHRIIDYISTIKAIKEFDKDFRKYGLGEYYGELSPSLSKHPKENDIKSIKILTLNIIVFAVLFLIPLWWYRSYQFGTAICFSLLLTAPIIWLNNSLVANNIRISKKIAKKRK